MKNQIYKNDTYNLYTIKTGKFKTGLLEVVFYTPYTEVRDSYISILINMLTSENKLYKTPKEFNKKLKNLYNAIIYGEKNRVDKTIITSIGIEFIDMKYTDIKIEDIIKFLMDCIFKPNIKNDEFNEESLNNQKSLIIKEINDLHESPKEESIYKALNILDENKPFSKIASGNIDIINSITPKRLYEFYNWFINNSKKDIYIIGDFDMDKINTNLLKYIKFNSINTTNYIYYLNYIPFKRIIKTDISKENIETNLVFIYSFKTLTDFEERYVFPLFNLIWGSGSLNSRLYDTLRNKNNLCYNVNSIYQRYDRLLIVHTQVDKTNKDLTIKLCKKVLQDMKKITDKELEDAKKMMVMSLNLTLDDEHRLIDNYVFKNIGLLEDIEKRIDLFKSVTTKDIEMLSKKIKLIFITSLGDK